jgi:hypothetical protein
MLDLLFENVNDQFEEQEAMKYLSNINDWDRFRDITETEKTVHVG